MTVGSSLKILILGLNFAPEVTGIAPYTTGLAEGLRDRGHEVRVITAFPHYPAWQVSAGYAGWTLREQHDRISVTRVRHYVPAQPSYARRAASEVSFGIRLLLSRWGNPDVVICTSPALVATAMAVRTRCRAAKVGIVVQDLYSAGVEEGGGSSVLPTARLMGGLESWVLRRADGVAVIHERFERRVVSRLGVSPDRVTVIRNWAHRPATRPFDRAQVRRERGWSDADVVVLHAGAMGEKQGLENVVAAAKLAHSRGTSVKFVLMGGGSQRVRLEQQSANCPNIEFLPSVRDEDFDSVLGSADILLVNERPGNVEMAVPSKLTSYFHAGRPVLAATEPTSTTTDELAASGAGVSVAPGDPAGLLEGVLRLSENGQLRHDLGAKGRIYCARVLDQENALDAYCRWVEALSLGRPRGARR